MTDLLERPVSADSVSSAAALSRRDVATMEDPPRAAVRPIPQHRPTPERFALSSVETTTSEAPQVTIGIEQGRTPRSIEIGWPGTKLPRWGTPLLKALQEVVLLPENWNSYGARRVTPDAIVATIVLLMRTMSDDTPLPVVVPTVRGGVQLEWHTGSVDLEMTISPVGRYSAFYSNDSTGTEWEQGEQDFVSPPEQIRGILDRLAR